MSAAAVLSREQLQRSDAHSVEVDRLAIRYQRGDTSALEPLNKALGGLIVAALKQRAVRARVHGLPGSLEWQDIRQEVWIALAVLAKRWNPAGGAFGAYLRVSLPWELSRHVQTQSGARRSLRVQVITMKHDQVVEMAEQKTDDGRGFAHRLALADALGSLSEQERAMVLVVEAHGMAVTAAGRRLGMSEAVARRVHRNGLKKLRAAWFNQAPPPPAPTMDAIRAKLLAALVAATKAGGTLPGRRWTCASAGITQVMYGRLMAQFVREGVIVGRGNCRPGRLSPAGMRGELPPGQRSRKAS